MEEKDSHNNQYVLLTESGQKNVRAAIKQKFSRQNQLADECDLPVAKLNQFLQGKSKFSKSDAQQLWDGLGYEPKEGDLEIVPHGNAKAGYANERRGVVPVRAQNEERLHPLAQQVTDIRAACLDDKNFSNADIAWLLDTEEELSEIPNPSLVANVMNGHRAIAAACAQWVREERSLQNEILADYLLEHGPTHCLKCADMNPKREYETAIYLLSNCSENGRELLNNDIVTDENRRQFRQLCRKLKGYQGHLEPHFLNKLFDMRSRLYEIGPFYDLLSFAGQNLNRKNRTQEIKDFVGNLPREDEEDDLDLVTRIAIAQVLVARCGCNEILQGWCKSGNSDWKEIGHYALKFRFADDPLLVQEEAQKWVEIVREEAYPARAVLAECLLAIAGQLPNPDAQQALAKFDELLRSDLHIERWEYSDQIFASYQAVRKMNDPSWCLEKPSRYFDGEIRKLQEARELVNQLNEIGLGRYLDWPQFLSLGIHIGDLDRCIGRMLNAANHDLDKIEKITKAVFAHPSWEIGERMGSHLRDYFDGEEGREPKDYPKFMDGMLDHPNWHIRYAATECVYQSRSLTFADGVVGRKKWEEAVKKCMEQIERGEATSSLVGLCVENVAQDVISGVEEQGTHESRLILRKHSEFLCEAMQLQDAYVLDLGHALWHKLASCKGEAERLFRRLPKVTNPLLPVEWWLLSRDQFLNAIEENKKIVDEAEGELLNSSLMKQG